MKNKELILEIVNLCLLINSETDLAVFFDFSGHVDTIDVYVCESKEKYRDRLTEFLNVKCDSFKQLLNVYNELKKYYHHD